MARKSAKLVQHQRHKTRFLYRRWAASAWRVAIGVAAAAGAAAGVWRKESRRAA
jgi:hypothetical protein